MSDYSRKRTLSWTKQPIVKAPLTEMGLICLIWAQTKLSKFSFLFFFDTNSAIWSQKASVNDWAELVWANVCMAPTNLDQSLPTDDFWFQHGGIHSDGIDLISLKP